MTDQAPRQLNVVRLGPQGGTPIVLVHAAGLDLTYWDPQIANLGGDFDIVAFDLPGHGATSGTADDWKGDTLVRVIDQAVATTGASRVHLVGVSLGGMLAQAFTVSHPSQVASLSLLSTTSGLPAEAQRATRARADRARSAGVRAIAVELMAPWFTGETVSGRPDLVDRARKTLLTADPEVHGAVWDFVAGFDRQSDLPTIQCPTLVLVGDQDRATPPASAVEISRAIPRSRVRVIPNAAHLAPLEQPRIVNEHLRAFLAGVAS